MAEKLNLKIITPEAIIVDEQVDAVYSVAVDGEFGILPGHIPFMTALDIGVSKYVQGNNVEYIATIGGILQVEGNNVTILSDAAERGSEIDVPRARAAKERAQARLGTGTADIDTDRAQIALQRAITRIKAASKSRS